ncbi:NEL-type E3 ubiquitin ligase domain-containing protein [Mesorhizobium metallidurans]
MFWRQQQCAKLRDRLGLQRIAPGMRFFGVSDVTMDDIDQAETSVRTKEAAELTDYLATDWTPWELFVSRIAPQAYAAAQDRLIDAVGDEFDSRLSQKPSERNLTGDSDAERELEQWSARKSPARLKAL